MASVKTTYQELQRARLTGSLTDSQLRQGTARLAEALAAVLPGDARTVVAHHRYDRPGWAGLSGLTRDGVPLCDVRVAYSSPRAQTTDRAVLLAFLDEYPLVIEGFVQSISAALRAVQVTPISAGEPGRRGLPGAGAEVA